MIIDGEALNTLGTTVDESQTMGLSSRELELGDTSVRCALLAVDQTAVVIHLAVDKVVVREWWALWWAWWW